jgi:hypothetical protein
VVFTRREWISLGITTGIALILLALGILVNGTPGAIFCGSIGLLMVLGCLFLQEKSKEDIFLYVLAVLVFTPVLYYSVTGHPLFYKPPSPPEPVTAINVDRLLKGWFDEANYGSQIPIRKPDDKEKFKLDGHKGGHNVSVFRYSDNEITVGTGINATEKQKLWLRMLRSKSPREFERIIEVEQAEILKFGFDYWPDQNPLTESWTINRTLRIQDEMKNSVIEACEQEYRVALVVEHSLDIAMKTNQVTRPR